MIRRPLFFLLAAATLLLGGRIGIGVWQEWSLITPVVAEPATTAASATTPAAPQPAPQATSSSVDVQEVLIPSADASPVAVAAEVGFTPEEEKMLTSLRERKKALDERSRQLDAREKAAVAAEEKAAGKIAELQQLEAQIRQRLDDEQKIKDKKVKRLAAVYEAMKPDKAAPVISRMDLETVVKMMSLMDEKKVGKILSFVKPEKAVQISEALTRRISSLK